VNFGDPLGLCASPTRDSDSTKTDGPVSCEYTQHTGELACTDAKGKPFGETGYSGAGIFKNWPGGESAKNWGPIPRGKYTIQPAFAGNYKTKGPLVMALTPDIGNAMFGRDGFLVHGDSRTDPGTASQGCIVVGPETRKKMSGGGTLTVTGYGRKK
jgi:hypothetical protein